MTEFKKPGLGEYRDAEYTVRTLEQRKRLTPLLQRRLEEARDVIRRYLEKDVKAETAAASLSAGKATEQSPEEEFSVKEYANEQERVHAAIEHAKRNNIITERVENPGGDREFILCPCVHPDRGGLTEEQLRSEAQMFQLAHCLRMEGMDTKNPFFVEGLPRDEKPEMHLPFSREELGYDLRAPKTQLMFYKHPEKLVQLFWRQIREKPKLTPQFFLYSSYENIQGPHSREIYNEVLKALDLWTKTIHGFFRKYHMYDESGRNFRFQGMKGTIDPTSGIPYIILNTVFAPLDEFIQDCRDFLDALRCLNDVNIAREKELVELLFSTDTSLIPIAYVGEGHETALIEACIARNACVRVLKPTAIFKQTDPNPLAGIMSPIEHLLESALQWKAGHTPPQTSA